MPKDSHYAYRQGAEFWSECRDHLGVLCCKVGNSTQSSHIVAVASHFQFDVVVVADSEIDPNGSLHFTENGVPAYSWKTDPPRTILFVPGVSVSKTEVGRRPVAMLSRTAAPHQSIDTDIEIRRDLGHPQTLHDLRLQIQLSP